MSGMQDSKRHYLILISVLSLSIIALLVSAILVIKPKIEKDLTLKVTKKLKQQGIDAQVSFSGRDGVIKGVINKSDIKKAEKSAYEVCGIHFIDNQLIAREEDHSKSPDNAALLENNKKDTPETTTPKIEKNTPIKPTNTETEESNDEKKDIKKSLTKEEPTSTLLTKEKAKKEEPSSDISKNSISVDKKPEPSSAKGNVQEYEKMLAAMTTYNKNSNKSRNSTSLSNATPFNIDTSNVTFSTGRSSIDKGAYEILDKLAEEINDAGDKKFNIKVTAVDSELAFLRAKSLRAYLVEKGIKKQRLIITGKGDSNGHSVSITEEN